MKSRTMIYLEQEQLQALKREAARQKISLAEIIRRAVSSYLADGEERPSVPREAYLKLVAIGSSGNASVSDRHDHFLAQALKREHSR